MVESQPAVWSAVSFEQVKAQDHGKARHGATTACGAAHLIHRLPMPRIPRLVLVDVANVLHAVGHLRRWRGAGLDEASAALQELLAAFPEVWFFEDGGPTEVSSLGKNGWRVRAGNADDALITWLIRHPQRRPLTVVSGDRDLGTRARAQGARVLDPVAFWRRFHLGSSQQGLIPGDGGRSGGDEILPSHEVSEWLRWFGESDQDASDQDRGD